MSGSQWVEGRSEDRLPWLEGAGDDFERRSPVLRTLLIGLAVVALVAAAVLGFRWYQARPAATGTGALITAEKGDYKVKPDQPGGMKAQGEGDTVFATSEGGVPRGRVDLNAVPEAPIATGRQAAAQTAPRPGASRVSAPVPAATGPLTANAPARATPAASGAAAGGGTLVQLGSFPDESGANGKWTTLSRRFGYLAPLTQSVERAEVNGATVYRLRVDAGGNAAARDLCGRLKVAGEACFVAR